MLRNFALTVFVGFLLVATAFIVPTGHGGIGTAAPESARQL